MRSSRLNGIFSRIWDNFANLFDFLSLDFPNQAYSTTFLLFWFILGLLGRMSNRGGSLDRTDRLGRSGDQRSSSCANVFPNTDFDTLVSHGARKLRGL
jgi:hypothetical protein